MSRRKKRFWSDEEKLEMCRQTAYPCVSITQVARRYSVNANLIFKWLKELRFAPDLIEGSAETVFLPLQLEKGMVFLKLGLSRSLRSGHLA